MLRPPPPALCPGKKGGEAKPYAKRRREGLTAAPRRAWRQEGLAATPSPGPDDRCSCSPSHRPHRVPSVPPDPAVATGAPQLDWQDVKRVNFCV